MSMFEHDDFCVLFGEYLQLSRGLCRRQLCTPLFQYILILWSLPKSKTGMEDRDFDSFEILILLS